MKVLVTGGAGFIGSHTCVELMQAGHEVVILDNLCNSHVAVTERIARIVGETPEFAQADVRDTSALRDVLSRHRFDAVIHFAGLKAVGESVEKPIEYYDNNVQGALSLCRAMLEAGPGMLVFSSSATVYGNASSVPIREDAPLGPTNPYGRSKWMVERILGDVAASDPARWSIALLRYFNPAGAHPSGLIGEDPQGIPNNLMPNIAQVAVGVRDRLRVFGSDYPTRDGIPATRAAGNHCESRHRAGNIGARGGTCIRAGERPSNSDRTGRPACGRRGGIVRRPVTRGEGARLEGRLRARRHVPRCMAMAKHEPSRLQGGRRAIGPSRTLKHRATGRRPYNSIRRLIRK
jgi:UDP-glucose 4-epimerase